MNAHRLLVLGGTGATGRFVVDKALAAGLQVTVFARDPSRVVGRNRPGLFVHEGDADDFATVRAAIKGHAAVACCLGPVRGARRRRFIGRAVSTMCDEMRKQGVRRLVFQSAFGVGDSRAKTPWWFRWFIIPTMLAPAYEDKQEAEVAVRASALDWTILRPFILSNGPPRSAVQVTTRPGRVGWPVPRANVADIVVQAVTAGTWVRETVTLGR